jgi:putative transposase
MTSHFNPDIHHRRSIPLKDYDYSQAGAYFITISTLNRKCLFGKIEVTEMQLNKLGWFVWQEWLKTPVIRPEIEVGAYVVMPNHFHGIVVITTDPVNGKTGNPTSGEGRTGAPRGPRQRSIGALVAGFKSAVTRRVNESCKSPGASLWQRNYYEHIIRNEAEYAAIVEYVATNPQKWDQDKLNPDRFWEKP